MEDGQLGMMSKRNRLRLKRVIVSSVLQMMNCKSLIVRGLRNKVITKRKMMIQKRQKMKI